MGLIPRGTAYLVPARGQPNVGHMCRAVRCGLQLSICFPVLIGHVHAPPAPPSSEHEAWTLTPAAPVCEPVCIFS